MMQQWMEQVLLCSISMALLTGLYYVATVFLRKRYASKWFYLAGIILLIGFLFPFRPMLTLESGTVPDFLKRSAAPMVFTEPAQLAVNESGRHTAQMPIGQGGITPGSIWQTVFMLWLAGASFTLLYHGIRHIRFLHLVKRWSVPVQDKDLLAGFEKAKASLKLENRAIAFWQCPCIPGPMLIWLGKPTVLFSEKPMSAKTAGLILQHELIHCKRKNLWLRTLMLLATAMHWFNPAIYFITRLVTLYCEMSCDEKAVESQNADGKHLYAMSVIAVAKDQSKNLTALSTTFYGGKDTMKKRITSILEPAKTKTAALLLVCTLVLTLAAGVSLAISNEAETNDNLRDVMEIDGQMYVSLANTWIEAMEIDGQMHVNIANEWIPAEDFKETDEPTDYYSLIRPFYRFGLTYDYKTDSLYYQRQLVQYFICEPPDNAPWYVPGYIEWKEENGTIAVKAVFNSDGELVGVEPFIHMGTILYG